jgi:hypothetical protein
MLTFHTELSLSNTLYAVDAALTARYANDFNPFVCILIMAI